MFAVNSFDSSSLQKYFDDEDYDYGLSLDDEDEENFIYYEYGDNDADDRDNLLKQLMIETFEIDSENDDAQLYEEEIGEDEGFALLVMEREEIPEEVVDDPLKMLEWLNDIDNEDVEENVERYNEENNVDL